MLSVYGIPNCDTVRKARAWLTDHQAEYSFHDFKKAGVPEVIETGALSTLGWEMLLNRRGTAWRALPADVQVEIVDSASAWALMQRCPSVIKRPVVRWTDGSWTVGFSESVWSQRLSKN